jgi:hypothetical protein
MDFGKILQDQLGGAVGDALGGSKKTTTTKRTTTKTRKTSTSNMDIGEIAKDVMGPGTMVDKAKNLADDLLGNGDGKLDASDVMGKLFGK